MSTLVHSWLVRSSCNSEAVAASGSKSWDSLDSAERDMLGGQSRGGWLTDTENERR